MKTEAEFGGMPLQAVKHLEPPEVEEAKEDSPLESLEGLQLCQHLDFGFLPSRIIRE